MKIRLASQDDKDSVYELMNELEEMILDKSQFDEIYLTNLTNPNIYYYVASEGSDLTGFVSLHIQKLLHHTGNIGEIQELIVTKQYRGRKIGRKLFDQAIDTAALNNCKQVEVSCNKRRIDSHVFYHHQGMTCSHYKFCLSVKEDEDIQ